MGFNLFKKKTKTEQIPAGKVGEKTEKNIEQQVEDELKHLPKGLAEKAKDPQVKEKIVGVAKKMKEDGVNLKNPLAIKKWLKQNEQKLKEENSAGSVDPITREEPKIGRNDNCPCGSGKKYKKCCGTGK